MTDVKKVSIMENLGKDTYESIMHLNYNLKELSIEIKGKLDEVDKEDDSEQKRNRREQILSLQDEILKALDGLEALINMTTNNPQITKDFINENEEEFTAFSDMIKDTVEHINQIKESL